MKTTVEMDDELFRRVKLLAAARGETLRALLERLVRRELDTTGDQPSPYVFRDVSVGGGWVKPEYLPWRWDSVREAAYEDRDS